MLLRSRPVLHTRLIPRWNSLASIATLVPSRLTGPDFLDVSDHRRPVVTISSLKPKSRPVPLFWGSQGTNKFVNFPPETAGFLYYHDVHPAHPVLGEVRFRVTGSRDPSSFSSGSDLVGIRGNPWRILLATIARSKNYGGFARLLQQEGLVDVDILQNLAQMRSAPRPQAQLVALGQPFLLNLEDQNTRLWFSSGQHLHHVALQLSREKRHDWLLSMPYSGVQHK
jgi:hypothetical protein